MNSVFGSLGVNYTLFQALQYLWPVSRPDQVLAQLRQQLSQLWPGETYLFYKGRQAITCALVALGLPAGSGVLLSAFTCHAIEEAIVEAGCQPVYADIAPDNPNAGVTQLQAAFDRSQTICRAVLIQHTLGIPADMTAINAWAKDKGLVVIQDLAQSVGAVDKNGQLLAQSADIVILSFGQDKILDAVSGGACIIRLSDQTKQAIATRRADDFGGQCQKVPLRTSWRDMFYPILTWLMRNTYDLYLGRFLIKLGQFSGLLRSPVLAGVSGYRLMTARSARLAMTRLNQLQQERNRRAEISKIYQAKLARFSPVSADLWSRSSHQRFLITLPQRERALSYLASHRIYLSDVWYRASVDSGRINLPSQYLAGSCPRAESLAQVCLNLPTHRQITPKVADQIADYLLAFNRRKLT